jgi:hypothetical protein
MMVYDNNVFCGTADADYVADVSDLKTCPVPAAKAELAVREVGIDTTAWLKPAKYRGK